MGKRVKHGAILIRQSVGVIRENKILFLYPLLATALLTFVLGFGINEFVQHEKLHFPLTKAEWPTMLWLYGGLLLFFYFMHFLVMFFDAMMVHSTRDYFSGKKPSVMASFKAALECLWSLWLWATFLSTAGVILNLFQAKLRKIEWVNNLLSNQFWLIAIYFAIPTILLKKPTPVRLLRESGQLITEHWGSPIIANFGFNLLIFLSKLLALIPTIVALIIGGKHLMVVGFSVTVFIEVLIMMAHLSTKTVICSAIYLYATERKVAPGFKEELLIKAFKPYKRMG